MNGQEKICLTNVKVEKTKGEAKRILPGDFNSEDAESLLRCDSHLHRFCCKSA